MKKIIVTESQLKKLVQRKNLIKEQVGDKYKTQAKVILDHYNLVYKGFEVGDITCDPILLTYNIDEEHRSYGITGCKVYNIQGEPIINLTVTYYDDEEEELSDYVKVKLNWDKDDFFSKERGNDLPYIGVDNKISLKLINNQVGEIVCSGAVGIIYEF